MLTFFLFHSAMTSCQTTGSFQESILALTASSEPVKINTRKSQVNNHALYDTFTKNNWYKSSENQQNFGINNKLK